MAARQATGSLVERAVGRGVAAVAGGEMNHCGGLAGYCRDAAGAGGLTLLFAASGGFNSNVEMVKETRPDLKTFAYWRAPTRGTRETGTAW